MAAGFPIDYPIGLPLLIAVLVGITGAHILHVFRFFPIVLNIFVGLTSYIMVSSLCKSKRIGFYATFFIIFSGGFLWTTELFPIINESIDLEIRFTTSKSAKGYPDFIAST